MQLKQLQRPLRIAFAVLHLEQGRPLEWLSAGPASPSLYRRLGRPRFAQRPYVSAAHALAMTGQGEQAGTALAAFDALAVPLSPGVRTQVLQARASAWAAAA